MLEIFEDFELDNANQLTVLNTQLSTTELLAGWLLRCVLLRYHQNHHHQGV